MITATEEFVGAHPGHKGTIAFLNHECEEAVDWMARSAWSKCSRRDVRHRLVRRRRALSEGAIGDNHQVGRRGSFSGRLTVHGVQGTSPTLACENPVTLWPCSRELTSRVWDAGRSISADELQVSNLNAGTGALNVIPGSSRRASSSLFTGADSKESLKRPSRGFCVSTRLLYDRVVCLGRAVLHARRPALGCGRSGVRKSLDRARIIHWRKGRPMGASLPLSARKLSSSAV